MLPSPIQEFLLPGDGGDPESPNLFVFEDRSDAVKVSRAVGGETRVRTKRFDGRQRAVIEEKVAERSENGVSMAVWVDKPIGEGDG